MPIVIFLIGIVARATSLLSSSHAPMDHVFNGDCAYNNRTAATSQPPSIAKGCFFAPQVRHCAGQFFKMSRSMRSRSCSWHSRAISEAWSTNTGVACVVGRHAADAGSCRSLSTQRRSTESHRPSSLAIDRSIDRSIRPVQRPGACSRP